MAQKSATPSPLGLVSNVTEDEPYLRWNYILLLNRKMRTVLAHTPYKVLIVK